MLSIDWAQMGLPPGIEPPAAGDDDGDNDAALELINDDNTVPVPISMK